MALTSSQREQLIGVLSPILLLAIWEITAKIGWIDARFFPPPSAVMTKLVALTKNGELITHLNSSLQRLGWGFVLGGVPAVLLGLAMGLYRPIKAAFNPLVSATYPIPKSAIMPLILLIFGLGESSKIVMVALGVFYPVLINTFTGVEQIAKIHLDVGRNFRADKLQVFATIALPGALPSIMAGVKLGIGMGLILIAIAEMVGAKDGIGFMIWNAWQVLAVDTMYVGLIVIALLGFISTFIVDLIERALVPWRHA